MNFKKRVQNTAKNVQRNIVLQETTLLPSVSIPKVNKNILDISKPLKPMVGKIL